MIYERLVRMIDPQNHHQFIRDGFLRYCSCAQTIGCRRLHFWTRKTSRSKKSEIHGFILVGRAPYYHPSLRAGSVITEHPFVIRFIPQTTIDEVIENALVIDLEIHAAEEQCLGVSSTAMYYGIK
ncbi:hypothetical protein HID58_059477 [Brassica napus]|uniref:Uncharacterized protein n=1 Tax=Brassica napus TaxID=3708 RepID=A0ABQ7ZT11_BRANA|nr:hypothetical protein HID58_059477 [Brassica napus]